MYFGLQRVYVGALVRTHGCVSMQILSVDGA